MINTLRKILRGCVINLEVKLGVQDAKLRSTDQDTNKIKVTETETKM